MANSSSSRTSLVGLIGLSLLLTACVQSEAAQSPVSAHVSTPASSLPPSPSLDPRTVAERDAIAAYEGMIHAWVEAAKVSDPDAPALRQFASGQALRRMVVLLYLARDAGKVGLGQPVSQPVVNVVSPIDAPTEVTLADCLDDSNWLQYKASTGELWDDIPGGRHDVTAVVKRSDSGWKVDSWVPRPVGTC